MLAAILEVAKVHENFVIYLIIVAIILIGIDVVFGWRRAGGGAYYHRAP